MVVLFLDYHLCHSQFFVNFLFYFVKPGQVTGDYIAIIQLMGLTGKYGSIRMLVMWTHKALSSGINGSGAMYYILGFGQRKDHPGIEK